MQFLTRKFSEYYDKRHLNAIEKKAFYAAQKISKTGRAELVNEYTGLLEEQAGSRRLRFDRSAAGLERRPKSDFGCSPLPHYDKLFS
ncbi:MAG TPA: hypothetical protein VLG39_07405 [Nitrospirota bacterium]|nr:hypothetical protein [Nitrospirota bacterium]